MNPLGSDDGGVGADWVTRKSRLFKSMPTFIKRSVAAMLRAYASTRPSRRSRSYAALAVVDVLPIFHFLSLRHQ
jgi:hypothetical protein